jgi:hypothetical protein
MLMLSSRQLEGIPWKLTTPSRARPRTIPTLPHPSAEGMDHDED